MIFEQQKCILTICFLVHILFLISIFDIYFTSPIVKGISPQTNNVPALAKRLVLIVGDGLRADSFYQLDDQNQTVIPYLRYIIENCGRWGVSHTRVPTESRPGHVAIIAGFYEDPSAIFKGWKHNPIDFDSVFNQSSLTFGWGSPDILSIFNRGSTKSKIIMQAYSSDFEELFGKKESAVQQSIWAFEKFTDFLKEARLNKTLAEKLGQEKIIFFIHLLGIDTAGHSHKPHSEEYKNNIIVADNLTRHIELLINHFYNDNSTTFIFTSDHGMTDWGSHGEGSTQETEIPYVAWGAGISKPQMAFKNNNTPETWHLQYLERTDINQADLAPLMSILLGIPIPVNSVGILPTDILDFSIAKKSLALLVNVRQILAQFSQKRKLIEKRTLRWLYKPYKELADRNDEWKLNLLEFQFRNGFYGEVINGSMDLILEGLAGLHYYHNYYQPLLLFCIALLYIGWLFWLLLQVFINEPCITTKNDIEIPLKRKQMLVLDLIFGGIIIVSMGLLIVQFLPFQYYLYCCLPSLLWWDVIRKCIGSYSRSFRNKFTWSNFTVLVEILIGTELVVVSFFERRVLSVVILSLSVWPLLGNSKRPHFIHSVLWVVSCFFLMLFPLLPVIGGETNNLHLALSVILWWLFIFGSWYYLVINSTAFYLKSRPNFMLPCILFGITLYNVIYITLSHSAKKGLPYFGQILSWLILCVVPILPLFTSRKLVLRLLNIYFSFGILSLLFSVTYDALFIPLFSFHLFLWLLLENTNQIVNGPKNLGLPCVKFSQMKRWKARNLTPTDFRRAYLFFFYTVFSFFGIGNIASVNSFDTQWVRCFVSVFSPFTMMILILIKLVIPFFITACTFRAVNETTEVPVDKIFLIVLICCDLLGLNFLFLVKNVGSWLEIGSSVSHYVISQTVILFLVCLYILSNYFMSLKLKHFSFVFTKFKCIISEHVD